MSTIVTTMSNSEMLFIKILKNKRLQEKTHAENVAVEKKFHLEHVGKFKNSVYHWTTDLKFWHTGTNLGVKERGGAQFPVIRGINTSH